MWLLPLRDFFLNTRLNLKSIFKSIHCDIVMKYNEDFSGGGE